MAQQTDHEKLILAWRALAGNDEGEGWCTIPIEIEAPCHLLAGRHFPGNEESVLVGFNSVQIPTRFHFPNGRGFRIEKVEHALSANVKFWLALSRQPAGNLDMFARMAEDIIGMLRGYDHFDDETFFYVFFGRIKAWQEFMQSGSGNVLGSEAEIGLFGEISFLKMILETRIPVLKALESWRGPLDGLQDFVLGTGAIEVKSTVAVKGFPATIGSLEQLDRSAVNPLFLTGIRLSLDDKGKTLPELIIELGEFFNNDLEERIAFENLILQAGFLSSFSANYTRRFTHVETTIMPVSETFPTLTRGNIDTAIRRVQYELDLDLVNVPAISLDLALKKLGVV